jgi:hypothetical protein
MSSAWVPIEPVEPRITTSRGPERVTAPLSATDRPGGTRRLTLASGPWGAPGQDRAEIWRASAKSFVVRPPALCVLSVSVTLFHEIAMSG